MAGDGSVTGSDGRLTGCTDGRMTAAMSEGSMSATMTGMPDQLLYQLVKWCKSLPLFKNILVSGPVFVRLRLTITQYLTSSRNSLPDFHVTPVTLLMNMMVKLQNF